jgi:hypothetical protein
VASGGAAAGKDDGGRPDGSLLGIPVVRGDVARADGSGHDPGGLAAVLSRLT